jgi:UDP-N-acetylmuramate dehydrogenase
VGAYGVEAKDVIVCVKTIDTTSLEERVFSNEECRFGYRDSAFKHEFKGRYIVTSVVYRVKPGDAVSTREEIVRTRMAKLPTVGEVGSAGSFFMNPFVSEEKANSLLAIYPDMPHFPSPQGVKIPAAWLIEQCGWKGKRLGGAQVWPKQPLVIVNADNATPEDIMKLAAAVCADVEKQFGITITPEVNYI